MKQNDPGKSPDPTVQAGGRMQQAQKATVNKHWILSVYSLYEKIGKDKGKMAKGAAWGAFAAGENVLEGCLKQTVAHLIPANKEIVS